MRRALYSDAADGSLGSSSLTDAINASGGMMRNHPEPLARRNPLIMSRPIEEPFPLIFRRE